MKKLLVVRHCKSDWGNAGLSDHDRPLNNRGSKDRFKIADRLRVLDPELERIYHSTARRATDTAVGIFSTLGMSDKLVPRRDLYTFSCSDIVSIVRGLPRNENCVGMVGHNPGMTEFIQEYSQISLDNLPTGGFCFIHFDVEQWSEIVNIKGTVKFLEYPRMLT